MTTQLNSRRIYEWQITNWFANISDHRPEWPSGWERGTLQQLRERLQPYLRDTADFGWRVRDPKTGEVISRDALSDYWAEQDLAGRPA